MSAPVLILMTAAVFASGVVLLFLGPANRGSWVGIHKVTFIVWGVCFALHFLGHLLELPHSLHTGRKAIGIRHGWGRSPGDMGRWIVVAGALSAGLVLAIVLIPQFHAWTAHFPSHHHEG
jgi:hypothetical protein